MSDKNTSSSSGIASSEKEGMSAGRAPKIALLFMLVVSLALFSIEVASFKQQQEQEEQKFHKNHVGVQKDDDEWEDAWDWLADGPILKEMVVGGLLMGPLLGGAAPAVGGIRWIVINSPLRGRGVVVWLSRRLRPSLVLTRTWRRFQRSIGRLYKNRQRLSAASDMTHLVGEDDDNA